MARFLSLLAVLTTIVSTLIGCGGGSTARTPTSIAVVIDWTPPVTMQRYLPTYAASVKLQLFQTGTTVVLKEQTVNRPTTAPWITTVTLKEALPIGAYTLTAQAYTQADAAGDKVATATVSADLASAEQKSIGLNAVLTTTIDHISITGSPLTVNLNSAKDLSCTAYDSLGNAVMIPASALVWTITSGGTLGTLTTAGHLQTTGAGTIRVKVAETGAGKFAEEDVAVLAPARVHLFNTAEEYGTMSVKLDTTVLTNTLAPHTLSDYLTVPAGTHTILATRNYGSRSTTVTFDANGKYLITFDRDGAPSLLPETLAAPAAGKAKVRFLNTHWLNDNFEFFMYAPGGAPAVTNSMGSVSTAFTPTNYVEVNPGSYVFDVATPPGQYASAVYGQKVALSLAAGDIYTINVTVGWGDLAPNGTNVMFAFKEN